VYGNNWRELYRAAILEVDVDKVRERVKAAEEARRMRTLHIRSAPLPQARQDRSFRVLFSSVPFQKRGMKTTQSRAILSFFARS
jgi:hypothetical protein